LGWDTNSFGEESIALTGDSLETLFKTWLSQHAGAVLKVARCYTLNAEACQDLVQEILLQVWESLPRFQGQASAATWSYRVALNTALSWQRNERVRRARREPIFELESVSDASIDGPRQAEQHEAVERLYAAVHQLPKTDAALVLLYLEDMSYREMAEVLGISENHVGVKLNRAKRALGALLKEPPHEP
jgi:RNA polymerase sigma-70 factor (ECF subfamily)